MKKNLVNHPYAECYVKEYENGDIDFISYVTRVISIVVKNGKRMIECTGTYSPTTRKQIGWFLREYAPDLNYHQIKAISGEGFVEI